MLVYGLLWFFIYESVSFDAHVVGCITHTAGKLNLFCLETQYIIQCCL